MRLWHKLLLTAAVLCVGALILAVSSSSHDREFSASLTRSTIEADGSSTTALEISRPPREIKSITSSDPQRLHVVGIEPLGDHAVIRLRAGVLPGNVSVRVRTASGAMRDFTVALTGSDADSYGDGTPDFLRLTDDSDAESFRRWFAFLSESQFFMQPQHSGDVNDCAALVRFAYREALRRHDSAWAGSNSLPRLPNLPEIQQYQYPRTPLGALIFRTKPGPYSPNDLRDDAFAEFADAKTLREFNMHFVSRRVSDARTGDVLFFRQDSQRSPYHTMIYLDRSSLDGTAEPLVIYHTGPIGGTPGEIRRPTIQDLMHHPDARWRPLPQNRAFLGVYRWNILRGTN